MSDTFEQQDNDLSPNEQALSVALRLAEAGLKVFPAQNNGAPVPGFKWKDDATDDAATLRAYFLQLYKHSATAVGMPAGANDLVILDPDLKNGAKQGVEEFRKIVKERGVDLSRVPVINTPSGGQHYIFQQPTHARIGCGRGELHKHIDVKGDGGYVVAVGSIRDGKQYKQAEGSIDFLTLFRNGLMTALPAGLQQVIAKPRLATLDGNHVAEGMSIDLVREALNAIPNDEHFDDRGDWVSFAHAIFGATGGSVEGMELFLAWSETRDQKPGEPERVWESFTSVDVRAGAGTIRKELERRGLDDLLQKARKERTDRMFDDDPDDPDAPAMKPKKKLKITPTPAPIVDPSKIPQRQFLYGTHYIRKFASASVAPGGTGKSSVVFAEAVSMAIGRGLLDHEVTNPLRVWYFNAEDPRDELERRLAALVIHYELTDEEQHLLTQNLFIDTGRDLDLKIAAYLPKEGTVIDRRMVDAIEEAIRELGVDVLILDPFVSVHAVPENDNNGINAVAKELRLIADRCNISIEIVHHVRKTNGAEVTVEDGRGASALRDAVRSMRVFNQMNEDEAARANIPANERRTYFREDNGKANMAPLAVARWRRMIGVQLPNGSFEHGAGDNVGAPVVWVYEPAQTDVTEEQHDEIVRRLGMSEHGAHYAAQDWAGNMVAGVLGLDVEDKTVRRQISTLLGDMIAAGEIEEVEVPVPGKGRRRKILRPQ